LASGSGINVAITGMQLVVLFMLMATLFRVQDLWKWHKPIQTETGDYFPWKIDQQFFAKVDDLVGAVGKMAERDEKHAERTAQLIDAIENQNEAIRRFDDKMNRVYWAMNHPEASQPKEAS